MIVRAWHATATAEGADAYHQHFTRSVLPDLQRIDGYQGAYLLRRDRDRRVEVQVLTLWDSMEAISRFAGANLEPAVVDQEALWRSWSATTLPSPTTPLWSIPSAPTLASASESAVAEATTQTGPEQALAMVAACPQIAGLALAPCRQRPAGPLPELQPGLVDAVAVVRRGQRVAFTALRLEAVPGRWEVIELLY